jgi:hypothetical protein
VARSHDVGEHADRFFSSVDPQGAFNAVGQIIVEAVEQDKEAQEGFRTLVKWLAAPGFIDERSNEIMQRASGGLRSPISPKFGDSGGDDGLVHPEDTITLLFAGYVRALEILRNADVDFLDSIGERLRHPEQIISANSPELLGRLLLETEIRAGRNAFLRSRLQEAASALQDRLFHFRRMSVQLASVLSQPSSEESPQQEDLMFAAPLGQGLTDCEINGQPVDCGVVIIVIIIVVIGSTI